MREYAISCLEEMADGDLEDILLQFTQVMCCVCVIVCVIVCVCVFVCMVV